MMKLLDRSFRFAGALALGLAFAGTARAADYDYGPYRPEGVPCDVGWAGWYTLLPAYWTSAWLGHFSGGIAHYNREAGVEAMVWGDEKRCFPSRHACDAWVGSLRRQFHRPPGYWTCTPLR